MAYSNFTLETVLPAFHLEKNDVQGLFSHIEPVAPSAHLATTLERNVPLAVSLATEKAKSELIIAQVLVELREQLERRISFFSGIEFNVDTESGLIGICDFLINLSAGLTLVEAPVIIVVEAKDDKLESGFGQCVAEMVAAQRFNVQKRNDIPRVYGVITTGLDWLFLRLEGQQLQIDLVPYQIARCDKILGILASMVSQQA